MNKIDEFLSEAETVCAKAAIARSSSYPNDLLKELARATSVLRCDEYSRTALPAALRLVRELMDELNKGERFRDFYFSSAYSVGETRLAGKAFQGLGAVEKRWAK